MTYDICYFNLRILFTNKAFDFSKFFIVKLFDTLHHYGIRGITKQIIKNHLENMHAAVCSIRQLKYGNTNGVPH